MPPWKGGQQGLELGPEPGLGVGSADEGRRWRGLLRGLAYEGRTVLRRQLGEQRYGAVAVAAAAAARGLVAGTQVPCHTGLVQAHCHTQVTCHPRLVTFRQTYLPSETCRPMPGTVLRRLETCHQGGVASCHPACLAVSVAPTAGPSEHAPQRGQAVSALL
jgi:hypothetical protein